MFIQDPIALGLVIKILVLFPMTEELREANFNRQIHIYHYSATIKGSGMLATNRTYHGHW